MSVERFDMHGSSHINGEYVSYSDCAKLESQLAALKEESERLKATNTLDFEVRLAKFQEEVWGAAANEVDKVDYDIAGIDAAKDLISMYSRLKKDNEVFESCRLVNELLYKQIDALKARVEEMEKWAISKSLIISRLQNLPDAHRMNPYNTEIIWGIIESINDGDFDFKEPANEG